MKLSKMIEKHPYAAAAFFVFSAVVIVISSLLAISHRNDRERAKFKTSILELKYNARVVVRSYSTEKGTDTAFQIYRVFDNAKTVPLILTEDQALENPFHRERYWDNLSVYERVITLGSDKYLFRYACQEKRVWFRPEPFGYIKVFSGWVKVIPPVSE
jgi:hypothetical protein